MGVVLLMTLGLLALLCLVVGLALVLPVRLELEIQKQADWRVVAAIRPFGWYGPRIPIRKGPRRPKAKTARMRQSHRRRRKTTLDPAHLFPAIVRFVKDILGRIRVGKLTVSAQFGLGDPAMTGQAFGMLSPVMYGAPTIPGVTVHVVPDFNRTVLTGAADIAFSVVPITLLGPFIRLGWQIIRPAR